MQRIALKGYKPYYGRSFLSTIEDGFLDVFATFSPLSNRDRMPAVWDQHP
jgi:hypothetical protein